MSALRHYNLPGEYGDVQVGFYNGDTYTESGANDQKASRSGAACGPSQRGARKGCGRTGSTITTSPVQNGSRNRFVAGATFETGA